MNTPMNPSHDSFKRFSVSLAALFLIVFGAKLSLVQLYGSPLPLWDQWYEADDFFRLWVEGHLTWQAFFAPDNGHRIFCTRLLDFVVIWLNGRWEPMLQLTVNAFIHTLYVCGLAFFLWDFLGRKNGWFVCFLLVPFFALSYAGENAIWAITLEYMLDIFSLATMVALGFAKPGSRWWWFGLAMAVMSLFTMASGLLAPLAVGGLTVLRAIKDRRVEKGNLITLISSLAVVGLGLALHVPTDVGYPLQAHTKMEFVSALMHNLDWLFFDVPGIACVIFLPLVLLMALYFRRNFQMSRAAELLLGLGLWSLLQSIALAYGRANYGGVFPVSRYLDILNVFVIASLFASVLLAQFWLHSAFSTGFTLFPPLVFYAVILFGLCRTSQLVVEDLLLPTRMMNLVAEERVETFMATGNERDLLEPPTVRPNPGKALRVLRNPKLQTILPAVCLPATDARVMGRFTAVSQWLLRNSTWLLYGGLGLFAGLLGYALIRSPLGLAWENLPAFIALLAILAALGFIWSKAPVKRETIERDLDYKLAAQFKSMNNLKRAATFEYKADALQHQMNSDDSRRP
ncbi:MAG: hypothetical protein ABSD57_01735 [Verrucomicrobiota bacterium]|jgi:hypothetical protein